MHPGSTPHVGDDKNASPQEKNEANVYLLSEEGSESNKMKQ